MYPTPHLAELHSNVSSAEPTSPRDRPVALIVSTNWWPVSARLAMRLLAHGCEVVALCPRGHVLGALTGIRSVRAYSALNSLGTLESAIRSSNPTLVIPCDDRAVWQLHELYRRLPDLRALIARSLGDPAHFAAIRSRARLLEMAARSGIRVPETRRIETPDDITDWFSRISATGVLKLDGTWGGIGVSVAATEGEARSAWRRFAFAESRARRWKRRWKEWLVYADPLAFWDDATFGRRETVMQRYVAGRAANSMLACWRGEVLGSVNVEVLCTEGAIATAPSTVVRLIDHTEMTHAGEVLCRTLGLSGFHGLDFILDEGNRAHLIELNARCTRLGHLRLPKQEDLAALLAKHIGAMPPETDAEAIVGRETVAFFPQAVAGNSDVRDLRECHVDVPWSEPQLTAALLRRPWPSTRMLFRLYHGGLKKPTAPPPSIARFLRLAAETGHSTETGPGLELHGNSAAIDRPPTWTGTHP
jgi:hypothetical protein